MEAQLNQRLKMAKTKERIRAKAEASAKAKADTNISTPTQPTVSNEELFKVFSSGEKNEKTPRGAKPQQQTSNKKKKGKK